MKNTFTMSIPQCGHARGTNGVIAIANVLGLQVTVLCLYILSSVSVIAFQHCGGVDNL